MNLAHDPELQFIQVLRCGTEGRRSLYLGFDMGDYGWEHPLILEKEMPAEEAVRLLRRICAEGESPEQIAADCGFRDIGNPWEEEPEETPEPAGAAAPQGRGTKTGKPYKRIRAIKSAGGTSPGNARQPAGR